MTQNKKIVDAFLAMKLRPCDAWAHENPEMKKVLCEQIKNFPTFALPAGTPTVICGFVHIFGICTAWMVTGEGFEKSAPVVLQQQRALCSSIYHGLNLHRMDIEIERGRKDAALWAEKLGFIFETVLQRHGARGEDQEIYLWPDERKRA